MVLFAIESDERSKKLTIPAMNSSEMVIAWWLRKLRLPNKLCTFTKALRYLAPTSDPQRSYGNVEGFHLS